MKINPWFSCMNQDFDFAGLSVLQNTTWSTFDSTNTKIKDFVAKDMAFDKQGNKWVATVSGLVKFDNINWSVFDNKNSNIPDGWLNSLTLDKDSVLWIASSDGVFNLKNGVFSNIFMPSGVTGRYISNNIIANSLGNVWFVGYFQKIVINIYLKLKIQHTF